MLNFNAMASSVPVDFLVKSTGMGHVNKSLAGQLSLATGPEQRFAPHRALRLNCLTTHYADLWQQVATSEIATDGFTKTDARLASWRHLTLEWTRESALRTPHERRQALVELDALAAPSLGLTAKQLLLIYRVAFRILRRYERETYYDRRGKIVFTTNSKGLNGVGLSRKQWEEIQQAQAGDTLPDWASDQQDPLRAPLRLLRPRSRHGTGV